MKWLSNLLIVAAAFLLCGCNPRLRCTEQFVVEHFEWSSGEGDSSIAGQAFYVNKLNHPVKLGARTVILRPANALTREFASIRSRTGNVEPLLDEARAFDRYTMSDGDGNFAFNKLPRGKYILAVDATPSPEPRTLGEIAYWPRIQGSYYFTAEADTTEEQSVRVLLTAHIN